MGRAVAARTRAAADVLFGAICHRHPRMNGELTSIAFRVPTPIRVGVETLASKRPHPRGRSSHQTRPWADHVLNGIRGHTDEEGGCVHRVREVEGLFSCRHFRENGLMVRQ